MDVTWRIICMLIGYVFGGFLTAEFVARAQTGKWAHEIGTENPGMANIMGNVGKGAGTIVLLGDILKTVLALALSSFLAAKYIGTDAAMLYAGIGAILGHNFPLWCKGKGGKGVTVTCTWMILYLWPGGLLCCLLGGALVMIVGYLPVAAIVMTIAAIPVAFAAQGVEAGIWMIVAAAIMFSRHYSRLVGIKDGTETKKFRRKK